ncbi:PA3496 family putative envelope integrity protein [Colwellia psychrerythraea]|uniref:Uncharacterized protein n=1 Tax=Colwellia psychrerythraea TaxID=28229 RepID=A0A099K6I1_COLPS|nr:hypothetical protein [Colwellia psychrerythraea]KGJ86419.1 hypothetical protein ND2E_0985 [Colwellia psychrerythraea]
MSKPTDEQKQSITMIFAKKTHKVTRDRSDMAAVARRRRIEALEEQKRLDADFAF